MRLLSKSSLAGPFLLAACGLVHAASDVANCRSASVADDERIAACTRAIESGQLFAHKAVVVGVLSCGVDRAGLRSRWDNDDLVIRAAVCVNCVEKVIGATAHVAGDLVLVQIHFAKHSGDMRATCDCRLGADIRLSALPKRNYRIVRIGQSPAEGTHCSPTEEDKKAAAAAAKASAAWLAEKGGAVLRDAQAFESGSDVASAVKLYVELARAGSGPAALRLCEIYATGKGNVRNDRREASKWCFEATLLGVKVPEEIIGPMRR